MPPKAKSGSKKVSSAEAKRRKINQGLSLAVTGRERASMARKALAASQVNRKNKAAAAKKRSKY